MEWLWLHSRHRHICKVDAIVKNANSYRLNIQYMVHVNGNNHIWIKEENRKHKQTKWNNNNNVSFASLTCTIPNGISLQLFIDFPVNFRWQRVNIVELATRWSRLAYFENKVSFEASVVNNFLRAFSINKDNSPHLFLTTQPQIIP